MEGGTNPAVGTGYMLVGDCDTVCWEDSLEETRSCFDSGRMPMREDWARRNCQYVDEGSVGGGLVPTPEGDRLVQAPSAMDSVSTALG